MTARCLSANRKRGAILPVRGAGLRDAHCRHGGEKVDGWTGQVKTEAVEVEVVGQAKSLSE